jgi:cytochrome c2
MADVTREQELEAALKLAANRLRMTAIEAVPGTRQFYERGEWADEADAALAMPPAQGAKTAFLLTEDGEFNGNAAEDDYVREARTLVFDPGYLCVKSDGSGYFCVPDAEMVFEDDRSEGPDGPEGSVYWVARMNASEIVALRDFLNDAAPAQGVEVWPSAKDVADAGEDGAGFWRTCSGCHETNEGYPTGPIHPVLKCVVGGGCRECGGIGAIWDTTDYAEMADYLANPPAPAPWTPPEDRPDGYRCLVGSEGQDWRTGIWQTFNTGEGAWHDIDGKRLNPPAAFAQIPGSEP